MISSERIKTSYSVYSSTSCHMESLKRKERKMSVELFIVVRHL